MVRRGQIGGLLVALLVVGLCSCYKPPADRLQLGQSVPPLVFIDLKGQAATLSAWRGKIVILNIWATWCAPCRKELPSLQHLYQRLDPNQYVVLGLALDRDAYLVQEYLRDKGVNYPNFLDREHIIANKTLRLMVYPDTLVIGRDGRLLARVVGPAVWDKENLVNALVAAYGGHGEDLQQLLLGT